jgi:hypothetical protein
MSYILGRRDKQLVELLKMGITENSPISWKFFICPASFPFNCGLVSAK